MKKAFKVVIIFISCLVVGIALLIAGFLYYRAWTPLMDDGPFFGTPRTSLPSEPADQVMTIMDGMEIKVFSRKTGDPAPTVLLQDRRGKVLWCIFATAHDETTVQDLRFIAYKTFPFSTPRIAGRVNWTYGMEAM